MCRYPLNRKLSKSQSLCGHSSYGKCPCPCEDSNPGRTVHRLLLPAAQARFDFVRPFNTLGFREIREVERGEQSWGQCSRELIREMASCDSSETKANRKHHYLRHRHSTVCRCCLISSVPQSASTPENN